MAIPREQAIKKLEVIPVFVITDEKGVPLPIPRAKNLVLPLYLEEERASKELAALLKSNPNLKANVVPVPLNVMNERVAALNKELNDPSKPLVAPVVLDEADKQEAIAILKTQGLTNEQIQDGLNVPLFFTSPFLTINTPQGAKGVFFLSYKDLQKALSGLPPEERSKLRLKVADISSVIEEITKTREDSFVIFPTREYFRLVKKDSANAQSDQASVPSPQTSTLSEPITKLPSISPGNKESGLAVNNADPYQSIQRATVQIRSAGPSGTGVLVKEEKGWFYVLTARHVVSSTGPDEEIYVVTQDNKLHRSEVLQSSIDASFDLTVLRFKSNEIYIPIQLARQIIARPGENIKIAGWSLPTLDQPLTYRLLEGKLTSVTNDLSRDGYGIGYQTGTPTLPGMSGGPVVDSKGRLVGIHGRAERSENIQIEGVKTISVGSSLGIYLYPLKSIQAGQVRLDF